MSNDGMQDMIDQLAIVVKEVHTLIDQNTEIRQRMTEQDASISTLEACFDLLSGTQRAPWGEETQEKG